MKKFIDTNIEFKNETVTKRLQFFVYKNKKLPLPTEIEISESGTCNRKCIFCPRSDLNFVDIKEFISKDLICKVAKELGILNYMGVIRFSGFVEPMIDKNIYDHISSFKKFCSKSRVEIVTNGDPLNLERLQKLFKHGLDKVLISVYDGEEDVKKFQQMIDKLKLSKDQ